MDIVNGSGERTTRILVYCFTHHLSCCVRVTRRVRFFAGGWLFWREGKGKEAFVMRWVVYEGHLYLLPEKAPTQKPHIQALDSADDSEFTLRRADCAASTASSFQLRDQFVRHDLLHRPRSRLLQLRRLHALRAELRSLRHAPQQSQRDSPGCYLLPVETNPRHRDRTDRSLPDDLGQLERASLPVSVPELVPEKPCASVQNCVKLWKSFALSNGPNDRRKPLQIKAISTGNERQQLPSCRSGGCGFESCSSSLQKTPQGQALAGFFVFRGSLSQKSLTPK